MEAPIRLSSTYIPVLKKIYHNGKLDVMMTSDNNGHSDHKVHLCKHESCSNTSRCIYCLCLTTSCRPFLSVQNIPTKINSNQGKEANHFINQAKEVWSTGYALMLGEDILLREEICVRE